MIDEPCTARACANIALVKYWGKRDAALNLPAAGSLSLTLDALATRTTVRFDPRREVDEVVLDAQPQTGAVLARTSAWLDHVRALAGIDTRAVIDTANFFPTASGLASSASGFAALALAAVARGGPRARGRGAVAAGAAGFGLGGALDLRRPGADARGHARRR